MRTPRVTRLTPAICAVALLAAAAPLSGQKTDVIKIVNGDEVTGEIKSVDRGLLNYKTDDMGTLAVKWEKVLRITSRNFFEVELQSGKRYFGNLPPSDRDGVMVVSVAEFSDTLPLSRVVRISPIKATFLQRLRGYVDLGFTFQRANKNTQWTFEGQVAYRGRKWASKLTVNSYAQNTATQDSVITRNSAVLNGQRFLGNRWSAVSGLTAQQNDELQLDRRTILSGGGGYFLLQRIRGLVQVSSGITWTNELYQGNSEPTNSAELFFGVEGDYYHLDSPKTDVTATVIVYPSLTDFGRVRLSANARLSHELLSDFTISLSFFENYDSRPPSETATKNDYGFTLAVGYNFNQ